MNAPKRRRRKARPILLVCEGPLGETLTLQLELRRGVLFLHDGDGLRGVNLMVRTCRDVGEITVRDDMTLRGFIPALRRSVRQLKLVEDAPEGRVHER